MSNSGVFDVNDIRYLMDYQQWSGVGTLELIQTQVADGTSATLDFTSIQQSTYNVHLVTFTDMEVAVDGDRIKMRFFENGTVESAGVYHYATQQGSPSGFNESRSTSANDLPTIKNTGTDARSNSNGYTYIYNAGDSSKYTFNTYHSTTTDTSLHYFMWFGSGVLPQASTVDGLRFFSSANITGSISLYGIKYS
tara:strand:+ start:99 stop:680 length:582 start_codon:yes stop_codon:yes gene_type:complete